MPVVKSPRGGRRPYAPAKVSAAISAAYQLVYGPQTTRYRKSIQDHTGRVTAALQTTLGDGERTEWTREAILEAIHAELREHANGAVYETFAQSKPLPQPFDPSQWDRLEPMPDPAEVADRHDPVWTVLGVKAAQPIEAPTEPGPLDGLGSAVTRLGKRQPRRPRQPSVRRSAWFAFWTDLARAEGTPMDVSFLIDRARAHGDQRSLTPEGWWQFWQQHLDAALQEDPRLVGLLRAARYRRHLAELGGTSWLANSALSPEQTDLLGPKAEATLTAMWPAHLAMLVRARRLRPEVIQAFDLEALARMMDWTQDRQVDWRGLQALETAQALWTVESNAFTRLGLPTPTQGAKEPLQWAFMRLAMEAAHREAQPMEWVGRFYQALARRQILVVDALREAGKPHPTFLDDHTIRVGDNFKVILQAISTSALATQWTGTVTMDWRQVRAVGSPIAAGRRPSAGVTAFWESVDRHLLAQGRQGEDRPITVALPLWHREALALLTLRSTLTPRLQPTLILPDLFFERLRERGTWYFFDPHIFPEVRDGTEAGYLRAEAAMPLRRRQHGYAVQQMAAEQVWKQILQAVQQGSPYLVMEGSLIAASPFPEQAPSSIGLEGVGALPLPLRLEGLASSRWASGAVNLALTLDDQGQPDPRLIQEAITVLLRLLDNLTVLTEGGKPTPYRAVCIGPVGYYEAIDRVSAHMNHDPALIGEWVLRLAQAWHHLTEQANQALGMERGVAPALLQANPAAMGPGAFRRRLKALRKGQLAGMALSPEAGQMLAEGDEAPDRALGTGRFTVCSVWAPFDAAARVAGTTPGGIGTLYPVDRVLMDTGPARVLPTPFLLHHLAQQPHRRQDYGAVLRHPESPERWPKALAEFSLPDRQAWEQRLQHAALIRPWVEQGVSVTLPVGLPTDLLQQLLHRAWWLGLSTVRFAAPLAPDTSMDKPTDSP